MRKTFLKRRLIAVGLVPAVIALGAFRDAPAPLAVSGAFTVTYESPSKPAGKNASGASLFISKATGTNRNTGSGSYLADARVVNVDTSAMVNGNGTHSGIATFSFGGNTVVKRFTGAVKTVMKDGKPESTFSGTWKVISGTGDYAKITGSGTYSGRFETSQKYTVSWKGTVSM